jgi:hypothetical protein
MTVRLSASAATDDIVALIFWKYVRSSGYLRSPIVLPAPSSLLAMMNGYGASLRPSTCQR